MLDYILMNLARIFTASRGYRGLAASLLAILTGAGFLGQSPAWAAQVPIRSVINQQSVLIHSGLPVSSGPTQWLCRPGTKPDPCFDSRSATVIFPDGKTKVESYPLDSTRSIDCFYVYPTVSFEKTVNADLRVQSAETNVAEIQASRFSQVCKVYAPMYRQLTLSAIFSTHVSAKDEQMAFSDVQNAWINYMQHYNHNRGVVLIGHSQGSFMLEQLLVNYIEKNPKELRQLVSAIILGGNVEVPSYLNKGAKTQNSPNPTPGNNLSGQPSGTFSKVPLCRSQAQVGCVIAYSSFDQVPPNGALFGRVTSGQLSSGSSNLEIACTNPADLAHNRKETLDNFELANETGLSGGAKYKVSTPWVSYSGLLTGQCSNSDGAQWLEVDRSQNLPLSEPNLVNSLGPSWGLHLIDVNVALGNLVNIVRSQEATYNKLHKPASS